ncbi:MAG: hypothetical protein KatS3mg124_0470 [Porticoccaceae bacterium]|nr:MAG: hypothetical protein KatS3mg124_0470 [Porticoccaceae bacterium]
MDDEGKSHRALFLLAGFPASGKSWLLERAFQGAANPFLTFLGSDLHQLDPPRLPPGAPPLPEPQRPWLGGIHLQHIAHLHTTPPVLLIHLDLLNLLIRRDHFFEYPDEVLTGILPRRPSNILDEAITKRQIDLFLAQKVFHRFDRLVVNTLFTPWHVVAQRWLARPPSRQGNLAFLFRHPRVGRRLYAAVLRHWLAVLLGIPSAQLLITAGAADRLQVRPLCKRPTGRRVRCGLTPGK